MRTRANHGKKGKTNRLKPTVTKAACWTHRKSRLRKQTTLAIWQITITEPSDFRVGDLLFVVSFEKFASKNENCSKTDKWVHGKKETAEAMDRGKSNHEPDASCECSR